MARRLFGGQAAGRRLRGQTLTPPDDLPEAVLMSAQECWWAMIVESIEHRAMTTPRRGRFHPTRVVPGQVLVWL